MYCILKFTNLLESYVLFMLLQEALLHPPRDTLIVPLHSHLLLDPVGMDLLAHATIAGFGIQDETAAKVCNWTSWAVVILG